MKKVALIIGASSGIGKELVKTLVDDGYSVLALSRKEELLIELQNYNSEQIKIETIDIAQTDILNEKLTNIVSKIRRLDLFVLSAGIGLENMDLDYEIEKKTIDTNVAGFTICMDWAYKFFEKQGYGHIVAITSIAGLRGNYSAPSYNASKSYQSNYLEGLRQKSKKQNYNITITDIRPGFVDTQMAKGEGIFWMSDVKKATNQIYQAIKNKKQIAYISRRWVLIAMILKICPNFIYDRYL
jgi:short-subunit dehydrogenase